MKLFICQKKWYIETLRVLSFPFLLLFVFFKAVAFYLVNYLSIMLINEPVCVWWYILYETENFSLLSRLIHMDAVADPGLHYFFFGGGERRGLLKTRLSHI